MKILINKNYVISGGTSGIGYAIAENILENGGNVLITGVNQKKLNDSYLKLKKKFTFNTILKQQGDLNKESTYKKINNLIIKHNWKKISGIVANAGKLNNKMNELNYKSILWYLNANFFISLKFVENFLKKFNCNKSSIIFISSIATNLNISSPFGYSASKLMINHYSKYLSNYLFKKKIRVNTISPGNIFFKNSNWELKIKKNKKAIKNYIKSNVPLNRFGTPNEVSKLVIYLLSENSSFINGANITCDGGQVKYI